jgi:hypothetical protein
MVKNVDPKGKRGAEWTQVAEQKGVERPVQHYNGGERGAEDACPPLQRSGNNYEGKDGAEAMAPAEVEYMRNAPPPQEQAHPWYRAVV